MKAKLPPISESEWIVASVVWEHDGLTASEIAERLEGQTSWKQKTVNTFLTRLTAKGVLSTRPDGRAFRYFSQVPREQCVRRESESFMRRVFGGAVAPMLVHFCENSDLSDEEVARLRKILNRKAKTGHDK